MCCAIVGSAIANGWPLLQMNLVSVAVKTLNPLLAGSFPMIEP